MAKRWTLIGSVLRSRPLEEKIALVQTFSHRALPLFASGRLRPWLDRIYPIRSVAQAHARMESNANLGKIVLSIEDDAR
jgi:NADPH:quinone reductase-like Zn-dependent oxidoreductase